MKGPGCRAAMSEYNRLSAVEMRRMLGAGEMSAVDLLTDCIAAIDAENLRVNAVVTRCFNHARQQALACDVVRANGAPCGPLPFAAVVLPIADLESGEDSYSQKLKDKFTKQADAVNHCEPK